MEKNLILLMYLLALTSLMVSTASVYMSLIKAFPVKWLYYHSYARKAVNWGIIALSVSWTIWATARTGIFPVWTITPLLIMGLAVLASYNIHQEKIFKAVDFPSLTDDPFNLPLSDNSQLAVVEYDGVTKAYPLDYVIHHHIINDQFGEKVVSLTYCAMCRTIIPFDVTDIGPLFVASFKQANMIVADRKTKTWFQQATYESIIGELHPHSLTMIPFQILSWGNLKTVNPLPAVVSVTKKDLREFELPIPGIWRRIMASENTPGLSASERDKSFPARTHVVGITDRRFQKEVVYLKDDLMNRGIVYNEDIGIYLVAINNTVNGFIGKADETSVEIQLNADYTLSDSLTGTVWDIRGKRISGKLNTDLTPIALSDEYWFSWKKFHPASELIRM